MGPESDEQRPDDRTETGEAADGTLNLDHLVIIAVLSLIAVAPAFVVDLGVETFIAMDPAAIISAVLPFLLLVPVPAAYVAVISQERFRTESFGTAAALLPALVRPTVTPFALGLLLGTMLTSYKARSIFHGDNQFYTYYKAAGSTLTITAIMLGGFLAYSYAATPALQEDIQGNLTGQAVDIAYDNLDLASGSIGSGMEQRLLGDAEQLAHDTVTLTFRQTRAGVLLRLRQQGMSRDQLTQVDNAFTAVKNRVRDNVTQTITSTLQKRMDSANMSGQQTPRSLVAEKMESFMSRFAEPTPPVLALLFLVGLSMTMLFKLPFSLLAAVYAVIIRRVLVALAGRETQGDTTAYPSI